MATSPHPMGNTSHQIHVEDNKDLKDASDLEDLLESLTKASFRPFNKDKNSLL